MAGHSKWANIKHKKGAQDAKRSKIFQKVSKEIIVAIKEGGNDPTTNARLRLAIDKAKSVNVPNDNIKKLLDKSNAKDASNYSEITYEGYGPEGVAILVECLTDNVNRTAPLVKSTFSKNNGNLGTNGSVSYMFELKGILVFDSSKYNVEELMDFSLQQDILDFKEEEGVVIIEINPSSFLSIKEKYIEAGYDEFIESEVTKVSDVNVELTEDKIEKVERLINALEDIDDVQAVYSNMK